ncbi:MAG: hypothetical protein LBC75_13215 [Fibromonadaceae bacterium]|jgi:hypothetical protein|nr:hypothetical protein [Fibromonadaceae bacterium]
MANRRIKRLLLATTMLAAIFAYSCIVSGGPSYHAKLAKADWISYTSLYPNVTMSPGGYFLNEMAEYGSYKYGKDICNYYINSLSEEERNLYISQAGGRDNAIANCVRNNEQDSFSGDNEKELKNWLKSVNTPYYDAINREVFDGWNEQFLGFYYVGEQLYYIYVFFIPGE